MSGPYAIAEMLEESNGVVPAPLTLETRGLIGESQLRLAKKSVHLITISPEACIDQVELVRALEENWTSDSGLVIFVCEWPYSSRLSVIAVQECVDNDNLSHLDI